MGIDDDDDNDDNNDDDDDCIQLTPPPPPRPHPPSLPLPLFFLFNFISFPFILTTTMDAWSTNHILGFPVSVDSFRLDSKYYSTVRIFIITTNKHATIQTTNNRVPGLRRIDPLGTW